MANSDLKIRWCRVCKSEKEELGFAPSEANGSYGKCKDCTKWFKLKLRYGLSKNQYLKLLESQNNTCAICKQHERVNNKNTRGLVVDHNHKTGEIRGLVCNACNSILGYADADNGPELLFRTIEYLNKKSFKLKD
jgi:hypothetical protein